MAVKIQSPLDKKHYSEKKFHCNYDEHGQIRKFATPNCMTMFLHDRSFIYQNFVIDHKSFIVKKLLINNSLLNEVTKKCRLRPLKKYFYPKITFLEFIYFRVNILIVIKNTYYSSNFFSQDLDAFSREISL